MGYKMSGPSLYPNIKRSKSGYKINSKDNSEDQLIITSNEITMKEDNGDPLEKGPIEGTGLTTGNKKVMEPGETYTFKGDKEVLETPITQYGHQTDVAHLNGGGGSGGKGDKDDKEDDIPSESDLLLERLKKKLKKTGQWGDSVVRSQPTIL